MKLEKKQQLVVVGIRKKGEQGFKIKSSLSSNDSHSKPQILLKLA